MARTSDADILKQWHNRLDAANKAHQDWEQRFKCEKAIEYYLGKQPVADNENPYTANLVYATIEQKLPSLLFYHPRALVKARPQKLDDVAETADQRAQLRQDVLNTFIPMKRLGYKKFHRLALVEAFFKFGVVEFGYTADYTDNPNAGKPVLKEDSDQPMTDGQGDPVMQPDVVMSSEGLFIKWIPASNFRVPFNSKNILEHNDWVGYYEYHYPEDIRRNPRYKNTASLKATHKVKQEHSAPTYDSADEESKYRDMVKVWKIWDLRGKQRLVFLDDGKKFLLQEPMDLRPDGSPILPFADLKFHEIPGQYLPMPPVFNWLPLQDELNDVREGQRIHRKRFKRKFLRSPAIQEDEWRKIEDGPDGVCAEAADTTTAVQPIKDAPLDAQILASIPLTKNDFNEISGVSSEGRGVADADTATQANIINMAGKIRETANRVEVSDWLAKGAEVMLRIVEKRMALPFWVQSSVDLLGPNAQMEAMGVAATWQQITATDLGDMDFDVSVEIESMTPMVEEAERANWTQVLGIITNPQIFPVLASSPVLLRKTLGYYGIRNDKEIGEIVKMGQMLMAMMKAAAGAVAGGVPGQSGKSDQPLPNNNAIAGQLTEQIGFNSQTPV